MQEQTQQQPESTAPPPAPEGEAPGSQESQTPTTPADSPESQTPDPSQPPSDDVEVKLEAAAEAAKKAKAEKRQRQSIEQMRREVEQQQALYRRQYEEWQAQVKADEELKERDPLAWFEKQGKSYEEITARYLNQGKLPPELELRREVEATKKELEALKADRDRQVQELQESRNLAAAQEAEKKLITEAVANHEKYPHLLKYSKRQLVDRGWNVVRQTIAHYQQMGLAREEWPIYTEADILEALEEEARMEQEEALEKEVPKPAIMEPQKTAQNRPKEEPPPSLGNDATAEVAPGKHIFLPYEERRARFRKQLGIGGS